MFILIWPLFKVNLKKFSTKKLIWSYKNTYCIFNTCIQTSVNLLQFPENLEEMFLLFYIHCDVCSRFVTILYWVTLCKKMMMSKCNDFTSSHMNFIYKLPFSTTNYGTIIRNWNILDPFWSSSHVALYMWRSKDSHMAWCENIKLRQVRHCSYSWPPWGVKEEYGN